MKVQQSTQPKRKKKQKGSALLITFGLMTVVALSSVAYIDRSTTAIRQARHNLEEVQTTHLCEAGVQVVLRDLWRPFKTDQNFLLMEDVAAGASEDLPKAAQTGEIAGSGRYAAGIIEYYQPNGDNYARMIVVRAVGWIDENDNGIADAGEPRKTVDVTAEFRLARSKVFDYTYFINNYGWMKGFQHNWLYVNGDMRSNGNFDFIDGTGTINGSIIAAANDKLLPGASGLINKSPYKWTDSQYANALAGNTAFKSRMRQAYDPLKHGAYGSAEFERWRDLVYESDGEIQNGKSFGAVMHDAAGMRAWQNDGYNETVSALDPRASEEVIMPDLNDFGNVTDAADADGGRFAQSKAYRDTKEFFLDGTPNPNYEGDADAQSEFLPGGEPNPDYAGAYVDVWDSSAGEYVRVSSNGVVADSALLIGTSTHPIRIHGPVAVNGDAAVAGYIEGQGTIYASRNIHIIGSVKYSDPPDFQGSDPDAVEKSVEKKDFLGLAASQSIIMGDTTRFGNTYPLKYMTPPFTKPRLDEEGNEIPAYNAKETDSWGIKRYQSLLETGATRAAYRSVAAGGVNQIDAILYTNYVGGGNVGTNGGGMTLNGTIISRDESIVTWSLPIRMNYDNRIRERDVNQQPLIDLDLPRSPTVLKSTWQDRGFIND